MIAFIDLDHFIIPNELTYPGIVLGLGIALWGTIFRGPTGVVVASFWDAALGAALGAAVIVAINRASILLLNKEGMGGGDVTLLAMLGAFLGWRGTLLTLTLACLIGTAVSLPLIALGKRSRLDYVPFGPYLALGGLTVLFWGGRILGMWRRCFLPPL